ncbi:MAG: site-specific integrase [Actinomycetota bacterium]|nr:site-specific integrase [Actinomycetota bacterium]
MRWSDVDLDAGRLSVRQALLTIDYTVTLSEPKTRRGRRSLHLDGRTVAALRAHRQAQLHERLAWGPSWADTGLVFTRPDGAMIHPQRLSKWFAQRARGLPPIRLHDLRHSWATAAPAAGVHPKIVSERLGHATVSITLDTYSHVLPGMDADAAELVAASILT